MKTKKLVISLVLMTALLALLLSGCSPKSDSGSLEVVEEGAMEKGDDAGSGEVIEEEGAAMAEKTSVIIKDFKFVPAEITVKKGAKVTWRNEDSAPHTVESNEGKYTSDNLEKTDEVIFTFNEVGKVDYHCGIHPSMKGSVNVVE